MAVVAERYTGKVVVVTGANGGQGRAVAGRFAAEGATVLGVDMSFTGLAGAGAGVAPGEIRQLALDITRRTDVDQLRGALAAVGRCDVLYNNAGVYLSGRGDGPAGEADLDAWDRTIAVNLTGAYLMIDAVVPLMRAGGGGVVINVSSLAGVTGSRNIAYTASKAGLIGMTKSLAFTHGQYGIRSVAMSLGPVDTAMIAHTKGGGTWDDMLASVPLGRPADPEEIASWAAFLGSDDGGYASGANIIIDGGRGVGL
jgi:NAD(P)-dependent dehydrogenase (short-subunit alcohol dehydrogenase family)